MICLYTDRKGQKYRLLAEGHADDRDADAPLVCAAVSALTGALVQYASERQDCRFVRTSVAHGRMFFSCCGGLKNAYEMIVAALLALARQYPHHVCFLGGAENGAAKCREGNNRKEGKNAT